MTDENVKEVYPQEPIQETESTTHIPMPEQLQELRNHLHNRVLGEYHRFLTILLNSPIDTEAFKEGFKFLDTGMLWIKEAIYFGSLVNKTQVSTPQADSDLTTEVMTE